MFKFNQILMLTILIFSIAHIDGMWRRASRLTSMHTAQAQTQRLASSGTVHHNAGESQGMEEETEFNKIMRSIEEIKNSEVTDLQGGEIRKDRINSIGLAILSLTPEEQRIAQQKFNQAFKED